MREAFLEAVDTILKHSPVHWECVQAIRAYVESLESPKAPVEPAPPPVVEADPEPHE